MATRPAEPRLRQEHAPDRPQRPGRPPGRRAAHGPQGPRLYRPHVLQGLQRRRRARPAQSEAGQLRAGAAEHLEHPSPDPRRPAAGHQRQGHVRRGRVPGRARLLQGRARQEGRHRGRPRRAAARDWTAGMAVYDISKPAEPRQIGFMPVEGGGIHRIWYTGGRWAYCLGAARRLHRLHLHDHRHGRPDQAAPRPAATGCPA